MKKFFYSGIAVFLFCFFSIFYGQHALASTQYFLKLVPEKEYFSHPDGVAVDSSANLYVVDYDENVLKKFNSSGNLIFKIGIRKESIPGYVDGQLKQPKKIAVDNGGNIYIVDAGNSRIQKFNANGEFLTKWDSYGDGNGQFRQISDIAIDKNNNDFYIVDAGNNRIQKFNADGEFLTKWGSYGSNDGQFNSPSGIAIDDNGNIYVSDVNSNRIQKFDASGKFLAKWGSFGSGNGQFNSPGGIAIDASGDVYVVDTYNYRIQKFDANGGFLAKWGSSGSGDGQFKALRGIAIDVGGNIYIADSSNKNIQKFNINGSLLAKLGGAESGEGRFNRPYGVAVSINKNIYVADTANNRIQKFDANGGFLAKWGSSGSGDGQFNSPGGIAIDGSGNIYVADTANKRIQKFDANGGFLAKWGSSGSGDGQFNKPHGIKIDISGNIYVSDIENNRIQKFDANGGFLAKWGSSGSGDGQFYSPRGIAIDGSGNIYVADTTNNRIQKFDASGGFLAKWGSYGSSRGQFSAPSGIAFDANGNIYVSETENNRIQIIANASIPAPNNLFAASSSQNSILLSWNDDGYVYEAEMNGGKVVSGWIYENNFYFNGLDCSTGYNFRIRSRNTIGREEQWSQVFKLYTKSCNKKVGEADSPISFSGPLDFSKGYYYSEKIDPDFSSGFIKMRAGTASFDEDILFDNGIFRAAFSGQTPPLDNWKNTGRMLAPRMGAGSGVIGGKIYMAGGSAGWMDDVASFSVYNPLTDSWEELQPMSAARTTPFLAALGDRLYVIGGNQNGQALRTGEFYDISDGSWHPMASMAASRINPMGGVYNGKIYVFGGTDDYCSTVQSSEVYDPVSGSWSEISPIPLANIAGATAQLVDGKFYIAGGQTDCGNPYSDVILSYDPEKDTWNTGLRNMPARRSEGASIAIGRKFYYIGGAKEPYGDPDDDIYEYDTSTDTWAKMISLPQPLNRFSSHIIGRNLYIFGGNNFNWDVVDVGYSLDIDNFNPENYRSVFKDFSFEASVPTGSSLDVFYSLDGGLTYSGVGGVSGKFNLSGPSASSLLVKMIATEDGGKPLVSNLSSSFMSGLPISYYSSLFQVPTAVNWAAARIDADIPEGADVKLYSRTGSSELFDNSWSDWSEVSDLAISSPANRYLQFRIDLATSNSSAPSVSGLTAYNFTSGKTLMLPNTSVSSSSPVIILIPELAAAPSVISIPADVDNSFLDLSAVASSAASVTTASVPNNLFINASTRAGGVKLEILAGTVISAPTAAWSALISLPKPTDFSRLSLDNSIKAVSAYEIGDPENSLFFDKGVRLVFSEQSGKMIGYIKDGDFQRISSSCASDSQEAGDALPAGGDCFYDNGADLIVWTKHFSEYVLYLNDSVDEESNNPQNRHESTLLPQPSCVNVIYEDWQFCQPGFFRQLRKIKSQEPANCSLTAAQIEAQERSCVIVDETKDGKNDSRADFLALEKKLVSVADPLLAARLSGRLLLQVESKGEAWYINPLDNSRYYLGRPLDAFNVMKAFGLGVSNKDFDIFRKGKIPKKLSGRILLKTEDLGKAYYIDPESNTLKYLGRPEDAFSLMRSLGLGISNSNLRKIKIGDR